MNWLTSLIFKDFFILYHMNKYFKQFYKIYALFDQLFLVCSSYLNLSLKYKNTLSSFLYEYDNTTNLMNFNHSYCKLIYWADSLVTFIFEYTTLECGTCFLIMSGFPLSGAHGPFCAHG